MWTVPPCVCTKLSVRHSLALKCLLEYFQVAHALSVCFTVQCCCKLALGNMSIFFLFPSGLTTKNSCSFESTWHNTWRERGKVQKSYIVRELLEVLNIGRSYQYWRMARRFGAQMTAVLSALVLFTGPAAMTPDHSATQDSTGEAETTVPTPAPTAHTTDKNCQILRKWPVDLAPSLFLRQFFQRIYPKGWSVFTGNPRCWQRVRLFLLCFAICWSLVIAAVMWSPGAVVEVRTTEAIISVPAVPGYIPGTSYLTIEFSFGDDWSELANLTNLASEQAISVRPLFSDMTYHLRLQYHRDQINCNVSIYSEPITFTVPAPTDSPPGMEWRAHVCVF